MDKVFGGIFLVYFGLFRENSVCFSCFDTGPKHRNKPKKKFFGFAKQTEKQPKQIEFRFVSVRTEKNIWLFRGHPTWNPSSCVVRSRPPWSQVARKLTSPSPFPPHSLPIPISRPPRGFPKSIVCPTKMTSWSWLHIVRNSYELVKENFWGYFYIALSEMLKNKFTLHGTTS